MSPAPLGGNLITTGQVPHSREPSAWGAPCFWVGTRDAICVVHWGPSALVGDF